MGHMTASTPHTGVYLDHAATTPMRPEAVEAYLEHAHIVGNPAALHRPGQRARAALEEAREELAEAVEAHPTEVVFTSGGSESDSLAVLGSWERGQRDGRGRCLVAASEHPAVLMAAQRGAETVPVDRDGVVVLDALEAALGEDVAVLSAMTVNNETGVLQPLREIFHLAERSGVPVHTDAVQALGHVPLSFTESAATMMSLSAHKVGGPVGIGALLARRDAPLHPVGLGGGQERELRSGTQMVGLAAAFARAASMAVQELEAESARLRELSDQISELVVRHGGRLNSIPDGAPHIVNATFDGVRADDLLFLLDRAGIYASVGSACKAGVHQPSDVLLAMGRTADEAVQSLRFSIGRTSTQADIHALAAALPEALSTAKAAL